MIEKNAAELPNSKGHNQIEGLAEKIFDVVPFVGPAINVIYYEK